MTYFVYITAYDWLLLHISINSINWMITCNLIVHIYWLIRISDVHTGYSFPAAYSSPSLDDAVSSSIVILSPKFFATPLEFTKLDNSLAEESQWVSDLVSKFKSSWSVSYSVEFWPYKIILMSSSWLRIKI